MLNPEDVLVAVCCYVGDAHQVRHFLPSYTQYGHPVIIQSPLDSQVVLPGVESRFFGKRAYIGNDSLDRQLGQMRQLLEYPAKFFLVHDSDSLLLSGAIPDYLFTSGHVVWSNEVLDWRVHTSPYSPRLAFQPPYFFSRECLVWMLAAADKVVRDPITPFCDFFWMALCFTAGIAHRSFSEGVSFGTDTAPNQDLMTRLVREQGKFILHSVKLPGVYDRLCSARADYCKSH